jgi:sugar/nucleoside kinase (ribokinase family)
LEGYLWDQEHAKEAMLKAARAAKEAGNEVALTLSDSFCVDRHRESFRLLIDDHVDILFANESELLSLTEKESFEDAKNAVRGMAKLIAITRSHKGSVVLRGDEEFVVPAAPVEKVVDTTGAGDLYAAGFLFGYANGKFPDECARIGGLAAAEVISHYGARPEIALSELL